MSTMVYNEDMNLEDTALAKSVLIGCIREMLHSAESGSDIVKFDFHGMELTIDFDEGEIFLIS